MHDTPKRAQVRAVQEYVRELLELEVKFLIFAHHQVLLDGIQEVLNRCAPLLARRPPSCISLKAQELVSHQGP